MNKMDKQQFLEYVNEAYGKLQEKQETLKKEYNIEDHDGYYFYENSGSIELKKGNEKLCKFEVVIIGSWAKNRNTWMWGWANPGLSDNSKTRSAKLRELSGITETGIFNSKGFVADEGMAYDAVAIAIDYLEGIGMYKISSERGEMFLALMKEI